MAHNLWPGDFQRSGLGFGPLFENALAVLEDTQIEDRYGLVVRRRIFSKDRIVTWAVGARFLPIARIWGDDFLRKFDPAELRRIWELRTSLPGILNVTVLGGGHPKGDLSPEEERILFERFGLPFPPCADLGDDDSDDGASD
jgi:hypothetical protein